MGCGLYLWVSTTAVSTLRSSNHKKVWRRAQLQWDSKINSQTCRNNFSVVIRWRKPELHTQTFSHNYEKVICQDRTRDFCTTNQHSSSMHNTLFSASAKWWYIYMIQTCCYDITWQDVLIDHVRWCVLTTESVRLHLLYRLPFAVMSWWHHHGILPTAGSPRSRGWWR